MPKKEINRKQKDVPMRSLAASLLIHAFIVVAAVAVFNFNVAKSIPPSYISLTMAETEGAAAVIPEEKTTPKEEKLPAPVEEKEVKKEEVKPAEKPSTPAPEARFLAFSSETTDTSSLNQIYQEGTLNVKMKYPRGWTYIDQNVKNKLDGVTFWSSDNRYNPPPYVHLEVKEKYLFNPKRYKYQLKLRDAVAHYNDPSELSGQVSQEFYIRTENEDDFSIKLIMEGESNFKQFQPQFFGMIKTFRFGKSLF